MELTLLKTQTGALVPLDSGEADKMVRWKTGALIRAEYTSMRNGRFHQKYMALLRLAYDLWSDVCQHQEYKGRPVLPEFERFRKDVLILAGFFRPVFCVNGEVRLEAESLSFASMDEERFEQVYNMTIDVILSKVLSHKNLSRQQIDEAVNGVMRFA